jgi:hypothetical protein
MSYKAIDKPLTVKAVKALLPEVLSPKWRNDPGLLMAVKKGWIFPGKIVEDQLIEKSGGLLKANPNKKRTEDFDDYSDAKFLSVGDWTYMYRADLTWEALKNKKGALRIVVYERKQNRLYYFYIPRRAYKHMRAIKIPFDIETGDPKNSNKWWAYEIDSFKKLARIKKEDWINVR